jgi:hypothetical protein
MPGKATVKERGEPTSTTPVPQKVAGTDAIFSTTTGPINIKAALTLT